MHTTTQLLDAISSKQGNCSDYRLAKLLNTPQQTVSNWRTGRRVMSPDFAPRVAHLLSWDPAYIMACVEWERVQRARAEGRDVLEDTGEILSTWERIASKFRPAAASIALALCALSGGGKAEAFQPVTVIAENTPALADIYIMRTRARRSRRRWPPVERFLRLLGTFYPVMDDPLCCAA